MAGCLTAEDAKVAETGRYTAAPSRNKNREDEYTATAARYAGSRPQKVLIFSCQRTNPFPGPPREHFRSKGQLQAAIPLQHIQNDSRVEWSQYSAVELMSSRQ